MLKQQITKQGLCQELAQSAGVPEAAIAAILEQLAGIATREAKLNGGFLLPGIGMIENVERLERTGVNPATGEKIKIGGNAKLMFSFQSRFKKAVSEE